MKKLISLIAALLIVTMPAVAKDSYSRSVDDLPQAARTFLRNYFPKASIHHIKIEKHTFGGNEYDVILQNGTEIEFDHKGDWEEIDCGSSGVPSGIILKNISKYIQDNYKGKKIVKIEKKAREYEIELNNGVELKFHRDGTFIKED